MSATQIPARGRRHPMTVVTQARRYAEAGWKPMEIVRFLADDGIVVSLRSVIRWTNPDVVRADLRHSIARRRRDATRRSGRLAMHITNPTPEFKLTRMRALRELPVSYTAIAKVMAFDFGDTWLTDDKVRYALEIGHYPKERAA